VTDEFIVPFVCDLGDAGTIRDEDVCINFNFRADRARQITRVLARNSGLAPDNGSALPDAESLNETIPLSETPRDLKYICMTRYDKQFMLPYVVPPDSMNNLLANVMADADLRNLRVAETEKYAHVTYFFNGGVEQPFRGEERELVPSQKVATYDLAPEMSASGIADAVIKAIEDKTFNVIIVNFANADMVGHSGKIPPTIKGVEVVDACLGRIEAALKRAGGAMIVTADHGNAEQMIDPATGGPHTAHTTNPVPLILLAEDSAKFTLRPDGSLQDISPTVLGMLHIPQPNDMKGHDLRVPNK
jgi:2,3-bisphosphoglycerate-independent phosphoglycerate mutase